MTASEQVPDRSQTSTMDAAPGARQFDFWLGEWDLTWAEGGKGTNCIRAIMDDHVILEQFDGSPTVPFQGMSVSTYNSQLGKWQQTWVDNQGNYLDFTGGCQDGKMILSRTARVNGQDITQRMIFLSP
jgi:hypothetical protein